MLAPSTPKMYSTPVTREVPDDVVDHPVLSRHTRDTMYTQFRFNTVAGEPGGVRIRVTPVQDVIVVGAGPAGLAVARELGHRHSISALVVEKSAAPAVSWRNRYDNFRLNTNGFLSHLPGQRIPLRSGRWPTKEDMVGYFDSYVRRQNITLALGCEVNRIDRARRGLAGGYLAGRYVRARDRAGHRPLPHPRHPALAGPERLHRRCGAFGRLSQCVAVPRPQRAGGGRGQFGRRHRGAAVRQRRRQGLAGGAHTTASGPPGHRADPVGRFPGVVRAGARAAGRSGDRATQSSSAGRSFALRLRSAAARAEGDRGKPGPHSHPGRRARQPRCGPTGSTWWPRSRRSSATG